MPSHSGLFYKDREGGESRDGDDLLLMHGWKVAIKMDTFEKLR